jgi:hypothetical protein
MRALFVGLVLGLTTLAGAISFWPFPNAIQVPAILLTPVAAAIDTCSAATVGVLYYDTTGANPCVCNGSDWVDVKDASTTCS